MNYNFWISLTVPYQYSDEMKDAGKLIFPYYRYNEFVKTASGVSHFVNLPEVIRNRDHSQIKAFADRISKDDFVKGVIVNNIEGLGLLKSVGFSKKIVSGPGLYAWNTASIETLLKDADAFVYPFELTKHELKEIESDKGILTVYGRTPLMISANCIRNSKNRCLKGKGEAFECIEDRKNNGLPVFFQCENCYNIIYNPVVTSLHEFLHKDIAFTDNLLLRFTNESPSEVKAVIDFYQGRTKSFPIDSYTKAYFVHGVE